jgi:hypothetical protein
MSRILTKAEMIDKLAYTLGKLPARSRPENARAVAMMVVEHPSFRGLEWVQGTAMEP